MIHKAQFNSFADLLDRNEVGAALDNSYSVRPGKVLFETDSGMCQADLRIITTRSLGKVQYDGTVLTTERAGPAWILRWKTED